MRKTDKIRHSIETLARLAVVLGAASTAPPAAGHEIPSDVTVQLIVRPAGDRIEVMARVPLEAMQDIGFPTVGPGYLDIERAQPQLDNAAMRWIANDLALFENGAELGRPELVAARASIPSDRSFERYEAARTNILGEPLAAATELPWRQALLDVLLALPIASEGSDFSIRADLARLGLEVVAVIRYEAPDGRSQVFRVDDPARLIRLDPGWHEAAWLFVRQGFVHILDGLDHLLFLFCLVLPFRRDLRSLVWIVSAFTVAHSFTLIGSAYGLASSALWFTPLIETLIAVSIFYMALENIVLDKARMRWAVAFGFGLIHGFGFSFALRDTMQYAGDHILTSLLSFNIGVELGQLFVLALTIPILNLAFRFVSERLTIIVLSVIIGHTAWHWIGERYAVLSEYPLF